MEHESFILIYRILNSRKKENELGKLHIKKKKKKSGTLLHLDLHVALQYTNKAKSPVTLGPPAIFSPTREHVAPSMCKTL